MSEATAISGQQSAGKRVSDAQLSLAPGFSRVSEMRTSENRFNGFRVPAKPLKRFGARGVTLTRLKPGANESRRSVRRATAAAEANP